MKKRAPSLEAGAIGILAAITTFAALLARFIALGFVLNPRYGSLWLLARDRAMLATHRLPQQQIFGRALLRTTGCWRKVGQLQPTSPERVLSMSSVVVGWTGRCPDPKDRARLVEHLQRLAEVSDSYLRTLPPARSIVGLTPNTPSSKPRCARANIEHVNRAISGQIVISNGIVQDQNAFLTAAREANLPAADRPVIDRDSVAR